MIHEFFNCWHWLISLNIWILDFWFFLNFWILVNKIIKICLFSYILSFAIFFFLLFIGFVCLILFFFGHQYIWSLHWHNLILWILWFIHLNRIIWLILWRQKIFLKNLLTFMTILWFIGINIWILNFFHLNIWILRFIGMFFNIWILWFIGMFFNIWILW